ncbi:MAG: zinc ribbon domain-containing protein [bacterium]
MIEQLRDLIVLQDLDQMIADATNTEFARSETKMGFKMDGLDKLRETRDELAAKIDHTFLRTYERASKRYRQAIVPVRGGICLGCFVRLPTEVACRGQEDLIRTCENCGRILYWVE